MRVLILSANTGGGHNSAAKSIGEALTEYGATYEIVDSLGFLSDAASQVLSHGHNYLYRYFPQLFGLGYRFEENHSSRLMYESMALGAKKLCAYLAENAWDAIVCTHLFASIMVTEAKRKYGLSVQDYFVATDYTCYPGMDTVEPYCCCIPHESLREEYVSVGIPDACIFPTGIPVGKAFTQTISKAEARKRLHLPVEGRVVLLCFGSGGYGAIEKLAPEFSAMLPQDTTLVIICGHNARAYRHLKEVENERLVVVGFTKRIADYMAAADIGVSKPGGLSTTEMLAMGLPMVLFLAIPGCESHNLTFFERLGVAVACRTWEETIAATVNLLRQPEKMMQMCQRMQNKGYGNGAQRLAARICKQNEQK